MFRVLIYLLIPFFMLSGCSVIPSSSDVPANLSVQRTKVAAGKTSRNEIVEMFGEPFIRNDILRVEVYRISEDSAFYYLLTPLPFPVGMDETTAYALIVYDENSIVSDIDWGIFHSSDDFDNNSRRTARLVADGFLFESFEVKGIYPRTEVLFARESDTRQSLLSTAPQDMCLLYIAPGVYEYKIISDNEVLASYRTASGIFFPYSHPVYGHGWYLGFMTILIQPGEHILSIATRDLKPNEFKKKYSCNPGEKLYAYPNIEKYRWTDKMSWEGAYRYRGEIVISDTIPEIFEGRRLILYLGDKWLATD